MSIHLEMTDTDDVATLCFALLEAAERWEDERPFLARKYTALSDRIADELDRLPNPSVFRAEVEAKRAKHLRAVAG